jgi:hypothetical protein
MTPKTFQNLRKLYFNFFFYYFKDMTSLNLDPDVILKLIYFGAPFSHNHVSNFFWFSWNYFIFKMVMLIIGRNYQIEKSWLYYNGP